jgi:hypothetical protein
VGRNRDLRAERPRELAVIATLRMYRAFESTEEPAPDPEALLESIARSLDLAPSH